MHRDVLISPAWLRLASPMMKEKLVLVSMVDMFGSSSEPIKDLPQTIPGNAWCCLWKCIRTHLMWDNHDKDGKSRSWYVKYPYLIIHSALAMPGGEGFCSTVTTKCRSIWLCLSSFLSAVRWPPRSQSRSVCTNSSWQHQSLSQPGEEI